MEYLDFEKPIADLHEKINELIRVNADSDLDMNKEIRKLSARNEQLTKDVFSKLNAWQITQLARHPMRPYSLDYIAKMVDNFQELHGDRMYGDDPAIVAGLGWIDDHRVAIIGHQKGRDTKERTRRNFGMPRPEGYRKAQRVMKLAEQFRLPLLTFIDTPGAYPGVGAEERGQSQAIAQSLEVMATLKTPIISVVIGEGGSGGALAIGVCDYLFMLQYSTYSVISPEGCASILWKSAEKAADAAQALKVTTKDLFAFGLVDQIIKEPLGGAHRDHDQCAHNIKKEIKTILAQFQSREIADLLEARYQRLINFGKYSVKE